VAPDDRFDPSAFGNPEQRNGGISITSVVASWREPRDCFRTGRWARCSNAPRNG